MRITEKHYAPWVREQQEQAEADVKRTWAHDPIALLETKGTPEVHQQPGISIYLTPQDIKLAERVGFEPT